MKNTLLALAALNASACADLVKDQELSTEQSEHVAGIVASEYDIRATVQFMLDASSVNYDAQGREVKDVSLSQELDGIANRLHEFSETDRIHVYYPSDVKNISIENIYHDPGAEVAGFYPGTDKNRDIIRLNAEKEDSWSVGVFMHEVTHKEMGAHKKDMRNVYQEKGHSMTDLAETSTETFDSAATVGLLYDIVDTIYDYELNQIRQAEGTATITLQVNVQDWNEQKRNDWLNEQAKTLYEIHQGELQAYKITQEELRSAMKDGQLFEHISERRNEIVEAYESREGVEIQRHRESGNESQEGGGQWRR